MTLARIAKLTSLIQKDVSYQEVVKFLFHETPPFDSNFLQPENIACIAEDIQSAAYKKQDRHTKLEFSVIVPVFNGVDRIKEVLISALTQNQDPDSFEIIIVDDGSVKKSNLVVEKLIEDYPSHVVRYVYYQKNRGPAFARNIGILLSRSDFICFTDDDCTIPSDWLSGFKKDFEANPEIAGTGGWYKPVKTPPTNAIDIFNRFIFWEPMPTMLTAVKTFYFFGNFSGNTANICYKKSVLEEVGGFNHYFLFASAEDFELKIRIHKKNYSLLYNARLIDHRKRNLTTKDFITLYLIRGWTHHFLYLIHKDFKVYNRTLITVLKQWSRSNGRLLRCRHLDVPPELNFSYWFFSLGILRYFCLWLGKYGFVIWDRAD